MSPSGTSRCFHCLCPLFRGSGRKTARHYTDFCQHHSIQGIYIEKASADALLLRGSTLVMDLVEEGIWGWASDSSVNLRVYRCIWEDLPSLD